MAGKTMTKGLDRDDVQSWIRYAESGQCPRVVELSPEDFLEFARTWMDAQNLLEIASRTRETLRVARVGGMDTV
jgi:hypothetical protein